jgi:hypothetical protein
MVKLDLYASYYYNDEIDNENDSDFNYDDEFGILKQAFEKLCELNISPGKFNYNNYLSDRMLKKSFRNKMLNGENLGSGKGFTRSG